MVKEKPNSVRIYDKDGFRLRAACICVRSEAEAEVLLVTSSRRPELWIVPGGGVEPDEETSVTAVREVLEEAGVVGALGRCLGVFEVSTVNKQFPWPSHKQFYHFQNREHKHRTKVFVMLVTEELDSWEDSRQIGRKRQWFTVDSALEQLAKHKPVQRHYIMQLRHSKKSAANCPEEDAIFQHDAEFLRHDDCVGGGGGCEETTTADAEVDAGDVGGVD